MTNTQIKQVKDHLLANGSISRNHALRQFITRLGAIINKLNNEGWVINGKYVKTEKGKDYVYFVDKSPYKKVEYRVNGEVVSTSYEKTN